MGNRVNPLLNKKIKHSFLNELTFFDESIKFNTDLTFYFLIQNFFNNLNIPIHSIFLKKKNSNIYVYIYFYQSLTLKLMNKYLTQYVQDAKTNILKSYLFSSSNKSLGSKKKKFFSKILFRRKNFLDIYFFLLFFCCKFFNTKNVFLSLVNLNLHSGFCLDERRKKQRFLFITKKGRLRKKFFEPFSILKHYNLGEQKVFFRNNFFMPSYLYDFDKLFINSLLYQSAQLIGNFLKNLLEFNFHNQKGLRQSRIIFFFKRLFLPLLF